MSNSLPVVQTFDRAREFRIVIEGRFAGDHVREACNIWASALNASLGRKMIVDISQMSGYDNVGRKALRDMHFHGTEFAASTASSLVFLAEITAPRRRQVTVIPEPVPEPTPPPRESNRPPEKSLRAAAGRSK